MKKGFLIIWITFSLCIVQCDKGMNLSSLHAKISNGDQYWHLVEYKVNGIDSTEAVNTGGYHAFNETFFRAPQSSRSSSPNYFNRFYQLGVEIAEKRTVFRVFKSTIFDSIPVFGFDTCKAKNRQVCQRNVFQPEGRITSWKIERLHGGKFILTCRQNNDYYLEMSEEGR